MYHVLITMHLVPYTVHPEAPGSRAAERTSTQLRLTSLELRFTSAYPLELRFHRSLLHTQCMAVGDCPRSQESGHCVGTA